MSAFETCNTTILIDDQSYAVVGVLEAGVKDVVTGERSASIGVRVHAESVTSSNRGDDDEWKSEEYPVKDFSDEV